MFITVYTYRAKHGSAWATIRLHEELGAHPAWRGPGFHSSELLQSLEDPQDFVEISRFEDERSARETTRKREFTAWYARLLETLELGPSYGHFQTAVRSETGPAGRPEPEAASNTGPGGEHGYP